MRSATILLFSVVLLSVQWRSTESAICPGAACQNRKGSGGVLNTSKIRITQAGEANVHKENHNTEVAGTQHIIRGNTNTTNINKNVHETKNVNNENEVREFNKFGGTHEIKGDLNVFGLAKINKSRNEDHGQGGGAVCVVC